MPTDYQNEQCHYLGQASEASYWFFLSTGSAILHV
jgi:hypothetical protein